MYLLSVSTELKSSAATILAAVNYAFPSNMNIKCKHAHVSSHEEMDIRASAIFAARSLGYEKLIDLQMYVLLTIHSPWIS